MLLLVNHEQVLLPCLQDFMVLLMNLLLLVNHQEVLLQLHRLQDFMVLLMNLLLLVNHQQVLLPRLRDFMVLLMKMLLLVLHLLQEFRMMPLGGRGGRITLCLLHRRTMDLQMGSQEDSKSLIKLVANVAELAKIKHTIPNGIGPCVLTDKKS